MAEVPQISYQSVQGNAETSPVVNRARKVIAVTIILIHQRSDECLLQYRCDCIRKMALASTRALILPAVVVHAE